MSQPASLCSRIHPLQYCPPFQRDIDGSAMPRPGSESLARRNIIGDRANGSLHVARTASPASRSQPLRARHSVLRYATFIHDRSLLRPQIPANRRTSAATKVGIRRARQPNVMAYPNM